MASGSKTEQVYDEDVLSELRTRLVKAHSMALQLWLTKSELGWDTINKLGQIVSNLHDAKKILETGEPQP